MTEHPIFDTPSDAMRQRTVHGALLTGLSQAVRFVVQLLSVVILARMIDPREFGIYAMAAPIIGFAMVFQESGLAEVVISSRKLTQATAASLFWFNCLLAVALAIILDLIAPLCAYIYQEPMVANLIWMLAIHILALGATVLHTALLSRSMQFRKLAIIEIVRSVGSLLVAVLAAFAAPTVFALAVQTLSAGLIGLVMTWWMTGWLPRGGAPLAAVKPILHFGAGMTTPHLSNFLSRNADNMMIGWANGPLQLGLYDRAYKLLLMPLQQANGAMAKIIIPVLSRLHDEPDRYRSAYLRTLRQTLLLSAPGMAFLTATAPVLVPTLLGEQWRGAIPIFQWLGIVGFCQTVTDTFGWLFVSQRRTREYAQYSVFSVVTCLVAFALGLAWGAEGVAAAFALSTLAVRLPVILWLLGRRGPISRMDVVALMGPYCLAVLVALAGWLAFSRSTTLPPLPFLAISAVIIYMLSWVSLALTRSGRATLFDTWALVRRGR